MEPRETVAVALELAGRQLARLQAGDVNGFIDNVEEYARACDAVAVLAPDGDSGVIEAIEQLIAANHAASAELASLMSVAAGRLAGLQQSRQAATAYLATPSMDAITVHQM